MMSDLFNGFPEDGEPMTDMRQFTATPTVEELETELEAKDKRIEQLESALREVMLASGSDDDALCQHYSWIHDTAKQALKGDKP